VAAAEKDAASAPPATDAFPLEVATKDDAEFSLAPPSTDFSVLKGVLADLNIAFQRAQTNHHVVSGFASHSLSTTYLGTTSGQRRRYVRHEGSLELVARSVANGSSAWAGVGTSDFSEVSLAELDEQLSKRLGWAERSIELPAGRYEVVLPPGAVADLMNELFFAASGRDAEDGSNVFSAPSGGTRLGETLSSLPFSLIGDPSYEGLACAPFVVTPWSSADVSVFDNGCAIGPTPWIDGGRLSRFRYHRAGAKESSALFTPAPDNLILSLPGASATLDELIEGTERGLLLTCLWYIREVDPSTLLLTGLTRDGVYLVEHGEIVGAVNNFRFNESPVDVIGRCVQAGRTERAFGRETGEWMSLTAMPALRIPEFNMSTVSSAS
jgi:predicted Zn-dependent protease